VSARVVHLPSPERELLLDRLTTIERQLAALLDQSGVAALEPWLTKRQLASHLGVSPRWLDDRVAEGLPKRFLAGSNKFRLSEVEPWLQRHGYLEGDDG
jgi:predicted DNA-binding transcriptional regulator AlpA